MNKKKITILLLVSNLVLVTKLFSQTVSTTITYGGFQACGGCAVCGADYWCVNTPGSYCGNTPACDTKTFVDPAPPSSIITAIHIDYYTADCYGSYINPNINGTGFPTVYDGNAGCWCSANPCGLTGIDSDVFPCGFTNYNYGGVNTLQMCTGNGVCFSKVILVIDYVPGAAPAGSTYTWKGTASTDWFTACNWDTNAIPTSTKDVIIPGGTPYAPTIGTTGAVCNTLTFTGSTVLTITPASGALTVTKP